MTLEPLIEKKLRSDKTVCQYKNENEHVQEVAIIRRQAFIL